MQGNWKISTCGRTIDGSETNVMPGTEELIFGGRNIMMGYLKGEQQTKDTIDEDGWLHSGDCGKIDEDGFMTITGRIKELIITAGGENVPPVIIEDTIKEELPLLSNVVAIGDRRKFLSALFTLRVKVDKEGHPTDALDEKALSIMKEIGSSATTVSEARADEKVKAYLDEGLKRANGRATSRAQNIGKYTVLDHDFSINGNELTPTLKLKRKVVYEKYESVIEGMYAGACRRLQSGSAAQQAVSTPVATEVSRPYSRKRTGLERLHGGDRHVALERIRGRRTHGEEAEDVLEVEERYPRHQQQRGRQQQQLQGAQVQDHLGFFADNENQSDCHFNLRSSAAVQPRPASFASDAAADPLRAKASAGLADDQLAPEHCALGAHAALGAADRQGASTEACSSTTRTRPTIQTTTSNAGTTAARSTSPGRAPCSSGGAHSRSGAVT
ncbi:hypothetical protein ON010_g16976 [Phytophthora cinnamomi]|nr:hypothetical protein ON010_g16976 [Phytophthora cinnamomi]